MEIIPPKKIKIIDIKGKGRGVVASEEIKKGEIIETCPIIYLSEKEKKFIENESDVLYYYYLHKIKPDKICIMFGYGSMYNHDLNANADFEYDDDITTKSLRIRAIKDIKTNEEIVIDYEFDNNKVEFLNLN